MRKEKLEINRLREVVERHHWDIPRYNLGFEFNDDQFLVFLKESSVKFGHLYNDLPLQKSDIKTTDDFYLDNGWFSTVDAEIFYSMIGTYEPNLIIEVGSGNSTRLARKSIEDNKLDTRIISIDPSPRVALNQNISEHILVKVEELKYPYITDVLKKNDILFIDSSHQILAGGDVNFLFLEVLPRLQTGVLVHIHDIFLPFDYPQEWVVNRQWTWNEQYLVHAFLCFNDTFEILWPAKYMWETYRKDLQENVPSSMIINQQPSSFWLRKI